MTAQRPEVVGFYHEPTGSIAYLAIDPDTNAAAIIDPVLDYEAASGRTSTASADQMLAEVDRRGLTVQWILDTHPHADHFSAAAYLKTKLDAPMAIGAHIVDVQAIWKEHYRLPDFPADGSQWDRLFEDGDTFAIGNIETRVLHSPGHTLASITYLVGDAAFIHDTLFQPDFGTARCDFPGGDPAALYRSIRTILDLPDETRLFTGHDYRPGGRPLAFESTVAEQKRDNVHFRDDPDEATYVARRSARDVQLPMPALILHALQVNIRGGRLPDADADGHVFLKIPINVI